MAKQMLSEALFELKDKERRGRKGRPARRSPKPRRGRPRAFDSFYIFSMMLLGGGLILQVFAVVFFS